MFCRITETIRQEQPYPEKSKAEKSSGQNFSRAAKLALEKLLVAVSFFWESSGLSR
jgi:hypothetical protein